MSSPMSPAEVVAIGLCLLARSVSDGETRRHPSPCGWCAYPVPELRKSVDAWNLWAGYNSRTGTYAQHEVRVFADLPRARQEELVTAAQSFETVPA